MAKLKFHSGHSPGERGKPRKVREFKSGQGKARENVFLHVVYYCKYCSWCKVLLLWCNQVGIVNYSIWVCWRTQLS